jgi:hypothetical protein
VHLEDVMLRRAGRHYYFADAPERALRVAEWMSELIGWPEPVRKAELERYSLAAGWKPDAKTSASSAEHSRPGRQAVSPVA